MSNPYNLTPREMEVLRCLLDDGPCDKVVARRLGIHPQTVKSYCASIYRKMKVETRFGAVVKAFRERIIEIEEIAP